MKIFALSLVMTLVALAACNGQAQQAARISDSTDGHKHTAEYITQRLSHIYQTAYSEKYDLLQLDKMFMSADYNRLQKKAIEIAERDGVPIIDADHWVQGQDFDHPSMTIDRIENITDKTATAHIAVKPFQSTENATQVILQLVFERDDWFVDNMQQYYEGELLDEKAWYKQYVDNDGKLP